MSLLRSTTTASRAIQRSPLMFNSIRTYASGPGGSDVGATATSTGFKDREQVSCRGRSRVVSAVFSLRFSSHRAKRRNTFCDRRGRSSRSVSVIWLPRVMIIQQILTLNALVHAVRASLKKQRDHLDEVEAAINDLGGQGGKSKQ